MGGKDGVSPHHVLLPDLLLPVSTSGSTDTTTGFAFVPENPCITVPWHVNSILLAATGEWETPLIDVQKAGSFHPLEASSAYSATTDLTA